MAVPFPWKPFLALVLTVGSLFGVQEAVLRRSGPSLKSESNFYSSIARLQAVEEKGINMVAVGSSITGRLPDRWQGFPQLSNAGCDGGSAVEVLRAMDLGLIPSGKTVIVEANTLHFGLRGVESEVGRAMRGRWFRIGTACLNLSAGARPAGFIYVGLRAARFGSGASPGEAEGLRVVTRPQILTNDGTKVLDAKSEALVEELCGIFDRLEKKGTRVVMVWLPPRRPASVKAELAMVVARRSGVLWWDLGQDADPALVTLTDGVHMSPACAKRTVRSLLIGLEVEPLAN